MPGGFISIAVDPVVGSCGVVFASVPTSSSSLAADGDAHPGRLYAFDPIPENGQLQPFWDNSGDLDAYSFAKFVPPTLANGRVYLATSTNEME
jgi:hypothetical protein